MGWPWEAERCSQKATSGYRVKGWAPTQLCRDAYQAKRPCQVCYWERDCGKWEPGSGISSEGSPQLVQISLLETFPNSTDMFLSRNMTLSLKQRRVWTAELSCGVSDYPVEESRWPVKCERVYVCVLKWMIYTSAMTMSMKRKLCLVIFIHFHQ